MADGGQMWAQLNGGADPISAFAKGASLRAQLDSISAAAQANAFNNTLKVLQLNNEREDSERRASLAKEQMDISRFNAETNRINAYGNVARATASRSTGESSINSLIQLPDGSFGVDLGPVEGSTNVPHGTEDTMPGGGTGEFEVTPLGVSGGQSDLPTQMPTSGEGDMTDTPPLSQTVPQTAGLTLPIQGQNNGVNPLLPSIGQPAAAPAPGGVPRGGIVEMNGRRIQVLPPNTTITRSPRGTTITTRTPTAGKPKEVAQQDWNSMLTLAKMGGLELTGVDGFDANGRPQPKFEKPKEKEEKALYDFDQLDEEMQGKVLDSFKRVAFPVPPEGFSDIEKMAAVGINVPPDIEPDALEEIAAKKMTPELWTRGYQILKEKALANREQSIMEHAALLTTVSGKKVSPQQVAEMLPDYEPPQDTRSGPLEAASMRMTETGESVGGTNPAGAATPTAPEAQKLTPEQTRELGARARDLRLKVATAGFNPDGTAKDKASEDELVRIQEQLRSGTAQAPAAAPAAAPVPAAVPSAGSVSTAPFTGKIPTLAEARAQQEAEKQRPLIEEDNKQWTAAKNKAVDVIERVAKKNGVRPEVILSTIANDGVTDAAVLLKITDEPEWYEGKMFTRKSSTPGPNGVHLSEVLKALVTDAGLLKEKYGITLDQLKGAGNKAPLQVTSVKAK